MASSPLTINPRKPLDSGFGILLIGFILQPMFYHLGHFSKFVPADSARIKVTENEQSSLQFIGFSTPGPYASTVVVVLNTEDQEIALEIHDQDVGIIRETVPASSIQTYIW